jgi:hypothetical protein
MNVSQEQITVSGLCFAPLDIVSCSPGLPICLGRTFGFRFLAAITCSRCDVQEMLMQMHKQCEFFQHSVNINPRDDQAFASWGQMLVHLSMVCEQQVPITFQC